MAFPRNPMMRPAIRGAHNINRGYMINMLQIEITVSVHGSKKRPAFFPEEFASRA
jgi:hypothetical protein